MYLLDFDSGVPHSNFKSKPGQNNSIITTASLCLPLSCLILNVQQRYKTKIEEDLVEFEVYPSLVLFVLQAQLLNFILDAYLLNPPNFKLELE